MAKKALGQHFLSDPRILERIAALVPAGPGAAVVEIGPGKGALTRALLARGFAVTAIERDRDLVPWLRAEFPAVRLIEGDALDVDWAAAASAGTWYAVGNIPYNVTSPLLERALESDPLPAAIVFLVQKEVAARIGAGPGTADYGALSVGIQAAARVERGFTVAAGAFWPPPKVDSAVVRIIPLPREQRVERPAEFRRLVVALFGARRKQLGRALRVALGVGPDAAAAIAARAGLDPTRRPEVLTVAEFVRLHRVVIDGAGEEQLAL